MIDAHVHLWRLGANDCAWPTPAEGSLFRDFELPDLHAVLEGAGVARALLVQSQESARDTAWLLKMATDRSVAGVVGWADLRDRGAVAALAREPAVKGLRPMVQDRAADWYDRADVADGLAAIADHDLVLDALVRPVHLFSLDRLAARLPALRIVVDHAAKPGSEAGLDAWEEAMAPLADRSCVRVKLSGLVSELPSAAVPRVVERLLALFGAERLIWGSDWPVLTASSDYPAWLDGARALVPAACHPAVFGGNAARCYRLEDVDA